MNREAIKPAKWFRDTFIEHRDETRKAFAATHELITRLHGGVMAELPACATRCGSRRVDGAVREAVGQTARELIRSPQTG
jgi:hypothetical protein